MKKFYKQFLFIIIGITIFTASLLIIKAVNNRGSVPFIYLKMDEGYGQTVYDSQGNMNATLGPSTGSSSADPTWKPEEECKTGQCLYFDGTNDYVSIPDFDLD